MKMKSTLFLISFLALCLTASSQRSAKYQLFDLSIDTVEKSKVFPLKGEDMGFVQVEFTSTSCDSTKMKIGYALVDTIVSYPSTINGLSQPITLNKLALDPSDAEHLLFTHPLNGVTTSAFGFLVPMWRPNGLVFTIWNQCETGKINLIHKK